MQRVTSTDGTKIAYERHGEGAPIVLIHGGSSPEYWRPILPHFTDEFTVVLPKRRGHAESGDGDEYSLEREVADVAAVVEDLEGDPTLFGHSFGGLLAIETARIADVEGVAAYEPAVLVGEYRERASLADQMQAQLDEGNHREAMRFYVEEVIHGGDADDLDAWLTDWPPWPRIADLAEQVTRMNYAIEGYRLPDALDIAAPTLLLTGTEGPEHLRDGVRATNDALTDSRLVEFEGVGHGGPSEAPEQVTAAVRTFARGDRVSNPMG